MARHRGTSRIVGGAVAAAIVVTLGMTPGAASALSAPVAAAAAVEFEDAECVVEVPREHRDRVTCGYLTVPESRAEGADPERTIRLPVAVIESSSANPRPDPLVFPTSGGPGGGSLTSLWYFLDWADWATDDRDVIIIEQRGDQLAEPTLDCPELDIEHLIVDGKRLAGSAEIDRRRQQLQACHERLIADGIDLAAYTSSASAADLAELRTTMGYDQWNLYGISYGARLALTAMRDHPAGLRSVILDSPYPPNVNRYEQTPAGFVGGVDALLASCRADAACRDRYPDLEQQLADVLDGAAESPLHVTVKSPVDRTPLELEISSENLAQGLFDALYDPGAVRMMPFVIDQVARGNLDVVIPLAQQNIDREGWFAEGLIQSIECGEEIPFNDDALIAETLAADPLAAHLPPDELLREGCELWAVPALDAIENEAVASGIPTLIAVGGYDPITPLPWGEAAAVGLTDAELYEFPTMGHGSVWSVWYDQCPASIAREFLEAPGAELDSSCIADMAPTDFVTTADIRPTSAVYRFGSDVMQDRDPVQIAILAVTLVVLVVTLLYGLVYGLLWLARRRGSAPEGAMLAATVGAAAFVAYAVGLAIMIFNTDQFVLAFGVPTGIWPLLLLPWIGIAVTILLIVLLVLAWRSDDGGLGHRIALTVSAAASVGFFLWLLARGLLLL